LVFQADSQYYKKRQMRKKLILLVGSALALAILILATQSCVKNTPYFRFRYAIVQTLSNGQPPTDSVISQANISLRLWIVPERYYDRFAFNPADLLVSTSYAAGVDVDTKKKEEAETEHNDSLIALELWHLPAYKDDYVDSTYLAPFIRFRVQDADQWMKESQAVAYFNQKCRENKVPQYVDVQFDKFFHYTGTGYFSLKLYTRWTSSNLVGNNQYVYSTSNKITLK
jgi:hypothetical protein